MAAILSRHNKRALQNKADTCHTATPCNCRDKSYCPLEGRCHESSIVYKSTLKSGATARHYCGYCEVKFKARFHNHNQSLKHQHRRNNTELSKAVWKAGDAGANSSIEWSITAKTTPYKPGAKSCNIYLTKKLAILQLNPNTALYKRSKLNRKCHHKNKFKLKNFIA